MSGLEKQANDRQRASLGEVFAARAREQPTSVAVVEGNAVHTYADLDRITLHIVRKLQALGVKPEDRVAVCGERSFALIAAFVAVVRAGGAYVPLDSSYPDERLHYMVKDAGCRVLLCRTADIERLGSLDCTFLNLDEVLESASYGEQMYAPHGDCGGEDGLAHVIYTSGSTGQPKGVLITHAGILRLTRHGPFFLGPDDVMAHVSSISFDAATWEIWTALLNGASLVILPRDTVLSSELPSALFAHGVTVMLLTTALFHRFADEMPSAFSSVRYMLFGGEAADPARVARVLEQDPPELLVNAYGPTEVTVIATIHAIHSLSPGLSRVPIGKGATGVKVYVLDPHLASQHSSEPGELYLGGAGLARGYHGAPGLTASRFVPDPFATEPGSRMYRTGDVVRQEHDGAFSFVARADEQVKLRGFRIEPGEIEASLRAHPAVVDAVVVVRGEGSDRHLVAFVAAPTGVEEAALRQYLRAKLPIHMIPSAIILLDRLPISPGGKVDRAALRRGDFG